MRESSRDDELNGAFRIRTSLRNACQRKVRLPRPPATSVSIASCKSDRHQSVWKFDPKFATARVARLSSVASAQLSGYPIFTPSLWIEAGMGVVEPGGSVLETIV